MLIAPALFAMLAVESPSPAPQAGATPAPTSGRRDPCGGPQELLKKYLAASPCVFVAGQASLQATYATTSIPADVVLDLGGSTLPARANRSAIGYPGALINIGISQNAQIAILPPSFSQLSSATRGTLAAGATDMEFWYKQLVYVDPARGILGGLLLTYEAPTGSPGLAAPGPAYTINPLLNLATNRARTMGVSLAFPVSNFASASSSGVTRDLEFRSAGRSLLALAWRHAARARRGSRLYDQRHPSAAQYRAARYPAVSDPSDLWRRQLGRRSREPARGRHAGSGNVVFAHADDRRKLHVRNQRAVTATTAELNCCVAAEAKRSARSSRAPRRRSACAAVLLPMREGTRFQPASQDARRSRSLPRPRPSRRHDHRGESPCNSITSPMRFHRSRRFERGAHDPTLRSSRLPHYTHKSNH